MAMSISFHAGKNKLLNREFKFKASIEHCEYSNEDYPVLQFRIKEQGVTTGEVTMFLDIDQIADIRFALDNLLQEYTTKKTPLDKKLDKLI
jgi:hypothetical protein